MEELGKNIRRIRKDKGITIQDLAAATALSPSFISRMERGDLNPSIASVKKIADALGIQVASLFQEDKTESAQDNEESMIVRKNRRRKMVYPGQKVSEYLLTPRISDIGIEFLLGYIEPGGTSGEDTYNHNGEECILVLKGELTIYVNDRVFVLGEGDSMHFYSNNPHRWENRGNITTEAVWAVTPPSF
ncbi:MAG: cupin domain-containing protein [Spirochaetales bacterium]|nr:cupin domain-containing protein [Spirochaetales bacterium]